MNIVIKDNFYSDREREEARLLAISTPKSKAVDSNEFIFNDLISGELRDTENQEKMFSNLLNDDIVLGKNTYRKFNVCMNDLGGHHIHHDDADYIAIIYLNDEYSDADGTQLLRHIETGTTFKNEELFGSENISESYGDTRDITKWESYLKIQAKPGRLVIFEPQFYHSEMRTFGNSFDNARCVEIFHMFKRDKVQEWLDLFGITKEEAELI